MKSIKSKILVSMIAAITCGMVILGVVGISMNFSSSISMLKTSMEGTAQITASRVEYELKTYEQVAQSAGSLAILSDDTVSTAEKQNYLDEYAKSYGMVRGNLLNTSGVSVFDRNNYSDREYFQRSIKGECFVSTPVRSVLTNELTVIVSGPVWKDGVVNSQIVGVVYFVPDENFLNDIMTSVHVSENGYAYLIDKDGNTIADPDSSKVCNENIEALAQQDASLQKLAEYHSRMRNGETGTGEYKYDNVAKILAFAPVNGTDGWSVGLNVPKSDLMGAVYQSAILIVVVIVLTILVGIFLSIRLAISIGKPIQLCADRIDLLAEGNLSAPIPQIHSKDETGRLVQSTTQIVNHLQNIIGDIKYLLSNMAKGNLNVRSQDYALYMGDYSQVLDSFREITRGLSETLEQIDQASAQVAAGAAQVSSGAQALAQGASEQASTIQELSATVSDISTNSQNTSDMAASTRNDSNRAGSELTSSSEDIKQLNEAMRHIADCSQQISKIITTIEDIAFQTNILALNAAVEAARAGSAGKGFAVVADEVRNLASKSDQAAKATKELIEKSIVAVEDGVKMMDNVTAAVNNVLDSAEKAVQSMDEVATAIQSQTYAISQINQGIDQIASVVQTNSATAEQSAAASEELSGQADMLKSLIQDFQLRKD